MDDEQALKQRAYRLTEQGLARRNPPALVSTETVAALVYKLLVADVPRDQIEWVLEHAKVLTASGIEYTLRNRPPVPGGAKPDLRLVKLEPPFRPNEVIRQRVAEIISEAREHLHRST